jgi:CRISPR-associated protein Csx14
MADGSKAAAHVPVDLFNPGQVFACLGLLEGADRLCGDAEGFFDWSNPSDVRFNLRANGDVSPVERVLQFLDMAEAIAEAPMGSASLGKWISAWDPRPVEVAPAAGYPFPDREGPDRLRCVLVHGAEQLPIEYWGEIPGLDDVKFWAGSRGYPGVCYARDALRLLGGRAHSSAPNPFGFSAPQSSSFRFDWRRDYVPIDLGFTLNAHDDIEAVGFPIVEILAAVGLNHARPRRPNPRDKLVYEYAVMGRGSGDPPAWLPPSLLRAALGRPTTGGQELPWPSRHFRMRLDWPGKEGQARSITTVTEESKL